uniref:Uncharacterized protein n=1 Tax=viral metagenome TaxID=1070528 RepID=A0A6C0EBP2_9ZZZZ
MNNLNTKSDLPFNNSIINHLYNKALESKIDQQLAATILKSNKMISNPYCNLLSSNLKQNNIASLHAEAHAIIKYFGKSFYFDKNKNLTYLNEKKKKKIDLIVIRINKSGHACNARPCYNCLTMMKAVGIRKVYYSITLNIQTNNINFSPIKLVCENVKDMISIQTSVINRFLDLKFINNNKNDYYENLLKKLFPPFIKINNLNYFIEFNLLTILPEYKIKIIIENKKKYVYILNNNNNIIIKSNLI